MKVQSFSNYMQTTKNSTKQSSKETSFGSIGINELRESFCKCEGVNGTEVANTFMNGLTNHLKNLISAAKNYKKVECSIKNARDTIEHADEFLDNQNNKLSAVEVEELKANLSQFISKREGERLPEESPLKFIDATHFIDNKGNKTQLVLVPYEKKIQLEERPSHDGWDVPQYSIDTQQGLLFDEIPTEGDSLSQKISALIKNEEILGGKKTLKKGSEAPYSLGEMGGTAPGEITTTSIDDKSGIFAKDFGDYVSSNELDNAYMLRQQLQELRETFDSRPFHQEELEQIKSNAKNSKAIIQAKEATLAALTKTKSKTKEMSAEINSFFN